VSFIACLIFVVIVLFFLGVSEVALNASGRCVVKWIRTCTEMGKEVRGGGGGAIEMVRGRRGGGIDSREEES